MDSFEAKKQNRKSHAWAPLSFGLAKYIKPKIQRHLFADLTIASPARLLPWFSAFDHVHWAFCLQAQFF
jgi:hypothetical protein